MTEKTLGQIAFEAHRDFLDGDRPWSDVREPEREVWEATAAAVALAVAKQSQGWQADWELVARDGDGNAVLKHKETGGRYRIIPEEDL